MRKGRWSLFQIFTINMYEIFTIECILKINSLKKIGNTTEASSNFLHIGQKLCDFLIIFLSFRNFFLVFLFERIGVVGKGLFEDIGGWVLALAHLLRYELHYQQNMDKGYLLCYCIRLECMLSKIMQYKYALQVYKIPYKCEIFLLEF